MQTEYVRRISYAFAPDVLWLKTRAFTLTVDSSLRPAVVSSLGLLPDIVLGTALLCLSSIMLLLVLLLLGPVAGQRRGRVADRASEAVRHAGDEVVGLAARLLLLAREVLLTSGLLQGL